MKNSGLMVQDWPFSCVVFTSPFSNFPFPSFGSTRSLRAMGVSDLRWEVDSLEHYRASS